MDAAMQSKKRKNRDKFRLSYLKELGLQLLSFRAVGLTSITFLGCSLLSLHPLLRIMHWKLSSLSIRSLLPSSRSSLPPAPNPSMLQILGKMTLKLFIGLGFVPNLEVSLDTIMDLAKEGNEGRFHSAIYRIRVRVDLNSKVFSELGIEILLDLLASKYFKYTNICYFTYISLKKLTQRLDTKDISGTNYNTTINAAIHPGSITVN